MVELVVGGWVGEGGETLLMAACRPPVAPERCSVMSQKPRRARASLTKPSCHSASTLRRDMRLSVWLSVRLPVCLYGCLSAAMSACMLACPSVCLPTCLSICLCVRPDVRLPACLSSCQSACLPASLPAVHPLFLCVLAWISTYNPARLCLSSHFFPLRKKKK